MYNKMGNPSFFGYMTVSSPTPALSNDLRLGCHVGMFQDLPRQTFPQSDQRMLSVLCNPKENGEKPAKTTKITGLWNHKERRNSRDPNWPILIKCLSPNTSKTKQQKVVLAKEYVFSYLLLRVFKTKLMLPFPQSPLGPMPIKKPLPWGHSLMWLDSKPGTEGQWNNS